LINDSGFVLNNPIILLGNSGACFLVRRLLEYISNLADQKNMDLFNKFSKALAL